MKKKILIVDDSSTIRLQVTKVLTKAGFDVAQAEDGVEGADLIDRDEISLVLCDVNMPRMNGLSMLEHVKSQARHAGLPILMVTTEGQSRLIRRAKDAGAKGWIVKPISAEQLVATVQKFVPA